MLIAMSVLVLAPILGRAQHGGMGGGGGGGMGGAGGMGSTSPTSMGTGASGMSGHMGSGMPSGTAMSARNARRMHAEAMQRAHRDVLALDSHGNLMVRDEIVALGASEQALVAAQDAGFELRRRNSLEAGLEIVALGVPSGMSPKKALKTVRTLDAGAAFDFNHIYEKSGDTETANLQVERRLSKPSDGTTPATRRVGLIDGGLDAEHAALRPATIHRYGCAGRAIASSHGTAIASRLMAGFGDAASSMPRVDLYAVDAYCGEPTGGSIEAVIQGLAWLIAQNVPVINVSLVGPPNALLERIVESTVSRGHLIVAAVGNDGPSAPALYPAAYPGVIAVTAVDGAGKVLMEAGRGKFLSFSAPGADIEAAALPSGYVAVRGTSFAAPIVASRLALLVQSPERSVADEAVAELAATALDLGSPGRDPVYGIGCIGCSSVARPQAFAR